ncbi:hypothetical protein SAY86_016332 [Trapa natans]|uniref:BHLH domain-containing protein n=1 Tax=Trapa natans TaxID=22666 RepID=A0AAN7LJE7_TRANT|nr:hypothetical protein SAY86_016332 [Trapa natans]
MMELSQSRPFDGEGRKTTHDFLSICSHSNIHEDPRPPTKGNFLKTHDFLGKTGAREEVYDGVSSAEKPSPSSGEHLLPGGIGSYSISPISHFNDNVQKPEAPVFSVAQTSSTTDRNDDNSNCSSYSNSGFTLWEESTAKKGKTVVREILPVATLKDAAVKLGQWTKTERSSQSSSFNHHLSSASSLQPSRQTNQSFMDMMKSARTASNQEEELDDEEDFVVKKEISPAPGDLRVNFDEKCDDQKANTPRSKHSATEQRRRSKINDRFQTLRALLPQNDQKRDKASFLLEVIEYIQSLQEKVQKYEEGSYPGWNCEPAEKMTWRSDQRPAKTHTDHSRIVNGEGATLAFATKVVENNMSNLHDPKNIIKPDTSTFPLFKAAHPLNLSAPNKGALFPISLQPNMLIPARTGVVTSPLISPDMESNTLQPQSHMAQTKPWPVESAALNDTLKEEELVIKGGTISISSAYSRRLFDTLTQALHSSGIDPSQARISVQIDLGKKAKSSTHQTDSHAACSSQGITRPRVAVNQSDQALKKLKTGKS